MHLQMGSDRRGTEAAAYNTERSERRLSAYPSPPAGAHRPRCGGHMRRRRKKSGSRADFFSFLLLNETNGGGGREGVTLASVCLSFPLLPPPPHHHLGGLTRLSPPLPLDLRQRCFPAASLPHICTGDGERGGGGGAKDMREE